jgi:hypothetical protein
MGHDGFTRHKKRMVAVPLRWVFNPAQAFSIRDSGCQSPSALMTAGLMHAGTWPAQENRLPAGGAPLTDASGDPDDPPDAGAGDIEQTEQELKKSFAQDFSERLDNESHDECSAKTVPP